MNNINNLLKKIILMTSFPFFIIIFFSNFSYGVEPDEILKNQEYELRAYDFIKKNQKANDA